MRTENVPLRAITLARAACDQVINELRLDARNRALLARRQGMRSVFMNAGTE
jgi:hypothetical protein